MDFFLYCFVPIDYLVFGIIPKGVKFESCMSSKNDNFEILLHFVAIEEKIIIDNSKLHWPNY